MKNKNIQYRVGGLLYSPAINLSLADKIANKAFPNLTAMAFCLEDSIQDEALEQAEATLKETLFALMEKHIDVENLPLLFVRIRTPEHMRKVHMMLRESESIIAGYILPKFDMSNAQEYKEIVLSINSCAEKPIYIMPILESKPIADVYTRHNTLLNLKMILDSMKEYVLNVRVGGNDFSNLYGVRRSCEQTIYDIGVIRDILVDILSVFSKEYVVSGPVWEYFGSDANDAWAQGLSKELKLDRANGFIGKTAIHPSQLPIIFDSLKVRRADYDDARRILEWKSTRYAVEKSSDGTRMNEVKCHGKWAEKIVILGEIYGIKE